MNVIPRSSTFFKLNSFKNDVFDSIIKNIRPYPYAYLNIGGGGSSRRLENSLLYEKYLEKNFFSAATLGICALNPDTYKFVIKSGLNEKMGTLDFFF